MEDKNSQIVKSDEFHKTKEQWLEQGIVQYKKRRYKEALEACEHAIQFDPVYARAYHGKGLILTQMKEYEKARESYKQAHKLDPDNAKIYCDMGEFFYILEDYEKSRIFYKRAIKFDNKYKKTYIDKAKALLRKAYDWEYHKCDGEAIRLYNNVLRFTSANSRVRLRVRSRLAALESKLSYEPLESLSERSFGYISYSSEKSFSRSVHPFNCRCVECLEF